ncbi:DGQHR domain-containing protein [Sutcliffiella cohnii]
MAAEKNEMIKICVLEVEQKDNIFYIGKIRAKDLLKIATVKWRGSTKSYKNKYLDEVKEKFNAEFSENGIQRVLEKKRLDKLGSYIKDKDGVFPNSLIVSLNTKEQENTLEDDLINVMEDGFGLFETNVPGLFTLEIEPDKVDAFIVDGQHRLAAFSEAEEKIDEYELVVTFFLNMEIPLQAEIFATINGNQRPVNKSLLYDLQEFERDNYNVIKRCHGIVKWLNNEELSPFYNKIKMLGTGYGSISQSAFIDELVKYIRERKINKHRAFMREMDNKDIIKVLLSYFLSIQELFPEQWDDNDNYIFLKTTGFGALMKLLYYVYIDFKVNGKTLKKAELSLYFEKLQDDDFSKEKWGQSAGQGLQVKLFKYLSLKLIGDEAKLKELDSLYKELIDNN